MHNLAAWFNGYTKDRLAFQRRVFVALQHVSGINWVLSLSFDKVFPMSFWKDHPPSVDGIDLGSTPRTPAIVVVVSPFSQSGQAGNSTKVFLVVSRVTTVVTPIRCVCYSGV